MFRLFMRDGLVAGVLLALLAGAATLLGLPVVAPPPAAPWSLELARLGADPILLARDAALATFGLAALVATGRLLSSGLRLAGRDYPAMAHLAEVLAGALVRRVGALIGVSLAVAQGGGLARASGAPRLPAGLASVSLSSLTHRPATPPVPRTRSTAHDTPRRPITPTGTSARRPLRRVGLAVRYTVQSGDTMEDVAERFGLPDWRPIMRATRGLLQPVGGPIADPALIFPGQVLLIPLPCPALRVSGDHVLHVVRRQEYLSEIAARFLGDWRAYKAIGDLNRGVHQPDGGALEDDNLIQPGWVLRLPQEYVVAGSDGAAVTHRVIVDDTRMVHLRRGLRPRRPAPSPTSHHALGFHQEHVARQARRRIHIRPLPRPSGAAPLPSATRRPARGQSAPPRQEGARQSVSKPPPTRQWPGHPPRKPSRAGSPHHAGIHPKRHVHPTRPGRPLPPGQPTASTLTGPPRPVPIARSGRYHTPGEGRRIPPLSPITDVGRGLPLPLLLIVVPLLALVALKRRRIASTAQAIPAHTKARLVPSMRRAIEAVRGGVRGRLEAAVDAAAARDGDGVAQVITLLEGAGAYVGLSESGAALIRTVTVAAATIGVVIAARGLSDETLVALTGRLGDVLGTPVRGEKIAGANDPRARLTFNRAAVGAHGNATSNPPRSHPAPLLIPLGRTAEGADLYVNLARLGPVLIAGGARGANTLVATLLTSALAQADPARLRLLVSSNDDELRGILPALEHLEAPPADARDVSAAAGIVAQAHTLVLERFAAGDVGPVGPAYLVVLDTIEELRADPRALDRLDVICRNGRVCGVHVMATTSDPRALAEASLLEAFETRLARPLNPEESRLLYDDDSAARLAPDEALLRADTMDTVRLSPFTLPLPMVRAVVAHIAVALAPEQNNEDDLDAPSPADVIVSSEGGKPTSPLRVTPPADQGGVSSRQTAPDLTGLSDPSVAASDADRGDTAAVDIAATRGGTITDGTAVVAAEPGRDGNAPRVSVPTDAAQSRPVAQPAHDQRMASSDCREPATAAAEEPTQFVDVCVLGGITVLARGAPVVMQPREQRLLAALAIMGPAPVRPDRLVEALFADDDPLTGQDKLQHSITDVRLVLKKAGVPVKRAGVVRYTSAGYGLDAALVRADAHLFQDLLRRSETADARERGALLARAVELYKGDLCGDQELDWVEGYRYAWRKEYLEALYELALYYEQIEKDPLGALRVARRLAAEEPLQDHYHQMALEFIAAIGDLDALDRYYEEMRAAYAQCDTEIDGYTQALVERLRAQVERERRTPGSPAARAG